MAELSEIFGGGKLAYEEFLAKAGEMGLEIGDVAEMRNSYEAEIMSIRAQNALEQELEKVGAKNREIVMKLIDMQNVTVDDEGVHGITEQTEALKTSYPYLFEGRQDGMGTAKLRIGMPHKNEINDSESMSDRDFYRRVKKM